MKSAPRTTPTAEPGTIRQRGAFNSGLPLGGMGTGGVELWPDGRFHEWNITNTRPWAGYQKQARPGLGTPAPDPIRPEPMAADFFLRIAGAGHRPIYRWLFTGHGLVAGVQSHFFRHHNYFFIRTFPEIAYRGEFPFIRLDYIDPELPVELSLEAWSAFIPRQVKDSSLPGFFLDFRARNRTRHRLELSLLWQQQNLAGHGTEPNRQSHDLVPFKGGKAVRMRGGDDMPGDDTSGCMTIWAEGGPGRKLTAVAANPYMQNLIWSVHTTGGLEGPLIPERLAREEIANPASPERPNKGWLCVQQEVAPSGEAAFHFGMAWHFPNHHSPLGTRVGHAYENWFSDSAETARYLRARRARFHAASRRLPGLLLASDLPETFRLSLLDQLSTLIKSSQFIADGRFGVQEGHGCCAFNTMDVDHYGSYALSILFPSLRAKVLEMHTGMAHPDNGKIYHGWPGTVEKLEAGGGAGHGYNRWDCSCQYILQVWRDARWSGNRALMESCWPAAKRAMDLIIGMDFYRVGLPYIEGGITYDHWRMKGVVTYMAGLYLAALRAMEEMAHLLGDRAWEHRARTHFSRGQAAFESLLWNGRQYLLYYARRQPGWTPEDDRRGHEGHLDPQRPPEQFAGPARTTCDPSTGCCQREPAYQTVSDTGMMTDLLNGHATARAMGLGGFLKPDRVRRQLRMILAANTQPENDCVVNGSYPDDHFLDEWPFMQWQTPWTGTEFFLAIQCYAAGLVAEGDRTVDLVFARHVREGMRFDHAECNNHYARPLCLWGALPLRAGYDHDALGERFALCPPAGTTTYRGALVTATALGTLEYHFTRTGLRAEIALAEGSLALRELILPALPHQSARLTLDGKPLKGLGANAGDRVVLRLARLLRLRPGQKLALVIA